MVDKAPQKRMTVRRFISLFLVYVLLCLAGGMAASGFFAPAFVGLSKAVGNIIPSLQSQALNLDLTDLPQQSRLYASDGTTVIAQFYDQNRVVVPLKSISTIMQQAVVAREDRRFLEHGGIDPQGIARAFIETYVKGGDTQGGSTLTQQYVKNALIDDALQNNDPIAAYQAKEDSIARKLKEMLISVELEKHYSKAQILQGYLNIAQFGVNIYGVETAAEHFFSKSAKDLDLGEAATIAAITKNPSNYDPTKNVKLSQQQRNIVLDLMQECGFASAKEVAAAKAVPLQSMLKVKEIPVGCQTAGNAAFFCDYTLHQILNSPEFGKTTAERKKLLYDGGLNIYTTLDMKAQAAAWNSVTANIPVNDPSGLVDVIAAVQPGTGKVKAMAQNRIYDATTSANNSVTRTALNFAVDSEDGGGVGMGPGSSFKPINLIAWMESGRSINTPLRTATGYVNNTFPCAPRGTGTWQVKNSDGGSVPVETPLHALNFSHNTTQGAMAQVIGLCAIASAADQLGVHLSNTGKSLKTDLHPSMVIGDSGTPVSPLTMANMYATIAARGVECTPIAIEKVQNQAGKSLKVPSASCHQSIPKNIADTAAFAINQNVVFPGAAAAEAQLENGRATYAKTGTNQQDSLATAGFVPQLAAFAQVYNPFHPVDGVYGATINGVHKLTWYGADIALPTWRQFMNTYLDSAKIPADNNHYGSPDPAYLTNPGYTCNNPSSYNNSTLCGPNIGTGTTGTTGTTGENPGGPEVPSNSVTGTGTGTTGTGTGTGNTGTATGTGTGTATNKAAGAASNNSTAKKTPATPAKKTGTH